MRKNVLVIFMLAVLALSCGCSSRQWNKGSELGENQSYAEQFSKAPDHLSSLLPEDNYTDDMAQALAGSDNYSDKQEYDLLISNYEQYGRYDGLQMIAWGGARYFALSDKEALCFVNYGINQAASPKCFEIYELNTAENTSALVTSSLDSYIIDGISDGENVYFLCSDGRLLCIDKDKSIKEETGAYDPSVYSSLVISLSGDSSVVSIVDIDGNTVWSKNV